LVPSSALKDLEEIDENLEKEPAFLTWAAVDDIHWSTFYQWLERVKTEEAKLLEEPIEGTSDEVETPVESK
jgi:replication fork clamp-binding protein CrfC